MNITETIFTKAQSLTKKFNVFYPKEQKVTETIARLAIRWQNG